MYRLLGCWLSAVTVEGAKDCSSLTHYLAHVGVMEEIRDEVAILRGFCGWKRWSEGRGEKKGEEKGWTDHLPPQAERTQSR